MAEVKCEYCGKMVPKRTTFTHMNEKRYCHEHRLELFRQEYRDALAQVKTYCIEHDNELPDLNILNQVWITHSAHDDIYYKLTLLGRWLIKQPEMQREMLVQSEDMLHRLEMVGDRLLKLEESGLLTAIEFEPLTRLFNEFVSGVRCPVDVDWKTSFPDVTGTPAELRDILVAALASRPKLDDPKYYEEIIPLLGSYYIAYKNSLTLPRYDAQHLPLWQWFDQLSGYCDEMMHQLTKVATTEAVPALQQTLVTRIEGLISKLPELKFTGVSSL